MSLEVDRRNYLPTVYPEHDESKSLALHPENRQVAYESQAFEEKSQGRRWCGLRPATLLLSIALAIATALAVIAAGVGGSLAAKNKYVPHPSDSGCVKLTSYQKSCRFRARAGIEFIMCDMQHNLSSQHGHLPANRQLRKHGPVLQYFRRKTNQVHLIMQNEPGRF
jgi:hypothetical protein